MRDTSSYNFIFRGIAQLVEQRSPKPRAEGSSPSAPAIKNISKRHWTSHFGVFLFVRSRKDTKKDTTLHENCLKATQN